MEKKEEKAKQTCQFHYLLPNILCFYVALNSRWKRNQ